MGREGIVRRSEQVRSWLGHVSLDTTHVHAEIDVEIEGSRRWKSAASQTSKANRGVWRNTDGVPAGDL